MSQSRFCWSVGGWTVNQRELTEIRNSYTKPAKRALRVPRHCSESDKKYHRRLNNTLRDSMAKAKLPDLDVYVLRRLYDYPGHLVRILADQPNHLTGRVMKYMDASYF